MPSYNQLAHTTFQQADGLLAMGNDWSLQTFAPLPPSINSPAQVISNICESTVVQYGTWLLWTGSGAGWIPGAQYAEAAIHSLTWTTTSDPTLNTFTLALLQKIDPSNEIQGVGALAYPDADGTSIDIQGFDNTGTLVGNQAVVTFVPDAKLRVEYFQGTLTLYYNNVLIQTTAGLSADSDVGEPSIVLEVDDDVANASISEFAAGTITLSPVFFISGSAGVAGATISYTGTSSGSVTADGSGNYSINGLSNGSYVITPTKTGYTFSPASQNVMISGSDQTGTSFTATAGGNHYSVPDCRVSPNTGVTVQGTIQYTGQTSCNAAIPPVDSRAAGAPVDSRATNAGTTPQNSRAPGTFGPGE